MNWTKKHFEQIAEVLKESETKKEIFARLCEVFEADNPKFDIEKFKKKVFE